MILAAIRNVRAIERADIIVGKDITLVAGPNSAGKSSIAQAVAAALAGQANVSGLAKKGLKAIVSDGAATASVSITGPDGRVSIAWPKGEVKSEGQPLAISAHAAGLEHIIDMPLKERAQLLARLLKTDPDRNDLALALADAGIADEPPVAKIHEALDAAGLPTDLDPGHADYAKALKAAGLAFNPVEVLWSTIQAHGWDGALKQATEKRAKLSGMWEALSGRKFGAKIAAEWLPAAWSDDLADLTAEALEARVKEAESALEAAIAGQAADAAEVARLTTEAAKLPAAIEARDAAQKALDAAKVSSAEATKARSVLPSATQPPALECPCCSGLLNASVDLAGKVTLTKATVIPADEIARRTDAIAAADLVTKEADAAVIAASGAYRTAQAAVDRAADAKRDLDALPQATGPGGNVPLARAALTLAKERHAAHAAWTRHQDIMRQIAANGAVIAILDPAGLRQRKLADVLGTFNSILADLSVSAGWLHVAIQPDMSITFGGRPYQLLSGLGPQLSSDQYRVRAVLQVALAERAGDCMVILDAADVLDKSGREGLLRLIPETMAALICMTFSDPGLPPDLERAEFGRTYWIDGHVAVPLAEFRSRAKPALAAE